MKSILLTTVVLLFSGCAGQRAPEGGPLDTTPPEIISVYPAPNTVNYSDNKIIFEFSEYVDRRSVEESIFMSPAVRNIEFDWSGTEVQVIFNEPLRHNTTYVVTVGTDVKDVRAGNRMANAVSLAFSTGPQLDNGTIVGKVYDEKPDGIMIFSYRLNDIDPDTLNPIMDRPDYITQTGTTGDFTLTNLATGLYRLFAVRDVYRNLLYDPETDDAGTTQDVELTTVDTIRTNIRFILAKEDTTAPRIQSATAPDDDHIVVEFSEALNVASVRDSSFSIRDTVDFTPLSVRSLFPTDETSSKYTIVTGQQKENIPYSVTVPNVTDRAGLRINSLANKKSFTGSGVRDTIPPLLRSISVKDSTAAILSTDSIVINFTDAVVVQSVDSLVSVMAQTDSTIVPIAVGWRNPASLYVAPTKPYAPGRWYILTLKWLSIHDLSGNRCQDTVSIFKFSIVDPDQFGSIDGTFAGFGDSNPVVIEGTNITEKNQRHQSTKVSSSGTFHLGMLPEGNYVLKAFEDRNNNGIQDAGTVYPYKRSEQFRMYPDTIRVRARWPVDGVIVK